MRFARMPGASRVLKRLCTERIAEVFERF